LNRDDTSAIETASRVLKEYNVFDSADWLKRDDVRCLPTSDREELELWICEQAFRFAQLLATRPDSPTDWVRALTVLDHASSHRVISAFAPIEKLLRTNLQKTAIGDSIAVAASRSPAPLWLEKFLLGVVSETQCDFSQPDYTNLRSSAVMEATFASTSEALQHYEAMLELRPDSYWGHYRAAVAAQVLERMADTVVHLQACLEKRPNNPVLRGQLAGCLVRLGHFEDALEQCNLAIAGSPDFAEFYRTRAFIKVALGESADLAEDLRNFEIRSGVLPRRILGDSLFTVAAPFATAAVGGHADLMPQVKRFSTPVRPVDRAELDARACLAKAIQLEIHDFDVANSEVNKILILDPDHLMALAFRATQSAENADFDAVRRDLDRLLNHEDLYDYTREHPDLIRQLTIISSHLLLRRQTELAAVAASRAREVSRQLKDRWKLSAHVGLSHYALARVYAVMGQNDPDSLDRCGRELYRAIRANEEFRTFFLKDKYFAPVRERLLDQLPRVELMLEGNGVPRAPIVARSARGDIVASRGEQTDRLHASATSSITPFDR
jgi:tetratricopeptide (TPR) repeat protein